MTFGEQGSGAHGTVNSAPRVAALIASTTEAGQVEHALLGAGIVAERTGPTGIVDGIRSGFLDTAILCDASLEAILGDLKQALAGQPRWSFFPFVLLTERGRSPEKNADIAALGNIRVIEKPADPIILVQSVEASIFVRRRQRAAAAHLSQRDEAERKLQELTEALESTVQTRTKELRATNARLLLEIEERRNAEERLRESEERYRCTVELSEQLVWTATPEGRISHLSPRFSQVTGLDRQIDPHEGWLGVVHPDDYDEIVGTLADTVRSGEPNKAEFRMRMADGSYRTFAARAAPWRDEKGDIVCWYGSTEDIDDQRKAERALRESEELYRYTLELGQQMVWTAAPDGSILSMSDRFTQVTGKGPTTPPHEVVHPDDLNHLLETWGGAVATGRRHLVEFRMRGVDGSYRLHRARAAPRRDEGGKIIRWYGHTEDIEDQKRAETNLLAVEERYRLAAKATNDAIWDLDWVAQEIHWSDSSAACLGYPGQNLGTTPFFWWEERIHPEDMEQAVQTLHSAVRRGKSRWSATYRFRKADGEYATFFDRGFIVRDDDGQAVRFVGAMTDLSDRQKAEEQIRRMQAELIHVSRLSAMGTMASTLAHELNQPLTAVTNYIRGSRRLLDGPEPRQIEDIGEALSLAEGGALRAGQIVRRLRELVARGTAAMRPEELSKLIEEASVIAFLDAHVLGIEPKIELDPQAQWVQADRIQIQQVLINLIRNAVQAMQGVERREILLSTRRRSATHVEISVADTGLGISPEGREALFTPFQSTKSEGLGIGLSISRTIVEAHGGKIWAKDREGGGTVFRFTLPTWHAPPDKD